MMGGVLGGGAQGPSGQPLQQGLHDGTSMAPRYVLCLTWNRPCRLHRDAPAHTWSYRRRWEGPRALQDPGSPGGGEAAPEGGSTCTPPGLGLLPSQDQAVKVQADTHGGMACSPLARAHSTHKDGPGGPVPDTTQPAANVFKEKAAGKKKKKKLKKKKRRKKETKEKNKQTNKKKQKKRQQENRVAEGLGCLYTGPHGPSERFLFQQMEQGNPNCCLPKFLSNDTTCGPKGPCSWMRCVAQPRSTRPGEPECPALWGFIPGPQQGSDGGCRTPGAPLAAGAGESLCRPAPATAMLGTLTRCRESGPRCTQGCLHFAL